MRADNSRHIIAAAQQRHELTRSKAIQALRTLDTEGTPVTFEAVAQAALLTELEQEFLRTERPNIADNGQISLTVTSHCDRSP